MGNKKLANLPDGSENPLNAAVSTRDHSVVQMATDAVKHKQCKLAFQPVVQTHPPNGNAFYEGFIRVLDETGRVIPAHEFMPQVENTPIGRDLDCVALEFGLRTLVRNPEVRLSINMSARSIGYSKCSAILDRFLKRDSALGERLILEISESSAMQVPELVIDFMDRLQDRGIAFALDDFGASNFSFRHFRKFFSMPPRSTVNLFGALVTIPTIRHWCAPCSQWHGSLRFWSLPNRSKLKRMRRS